MTETHATAPSSSAGTASHESDLAPGTHVGEYVVEAVIGRGGFGTVYRAKHPVISKRVAVKVLSRRYSADEDMVSRFIVEARSVNEIQHRNIIDIFSFGRLNDGRHYYVMEYVAGATLAEFLDEHGVLTFATALPILKAIARALNAAHTKGIAYRDLKPENIILVTDEDGQFPKLLDFGIAKLSGSAERIAHRTGTGVPMGTPWYMSPEQCRGRDIDVRTDIYSFGVLAYRMLTGELPFDGELIEVMHCQIHDEPPPPSTRNPALGPEVDAAIAWMMKKAPGERPASVLDGLLALAPGVPGLLTPVPMLALSALVPRGTPPSRRTAGTSHRAPPSAAAPVDAPDRPWPRTPLVVGASAIAVAAMVLLVLLRRGGDPTMAPMATSPPRAVAGPIDAAVADAPALVAHVTPDAAPVAATEPAPHATATPPAATTRTLQIVGAPRGAVVSRDGERLGSASAPITLPVDDQPIELLVEATGYRTARIRIAPGQASAQVTLARRATPGTDRARTDENDIMSFPR